MSSTIYGGITSNGVVVQDMVDDNQDFVFRDERFNGYFARFVQTLEREDDEEFSTAAPGIAIFSDNDPFTPIYGVRLTGSFADYQEGFGMTELFLHDLSLIWDEFAENNRKPKIENSELLYCN